MRTLHVDGDSQIATIQGVQATAAHSMRPITRKTIHDFVKGLPGDQKGVAEGAFRAWLKLLEGATWKDFASLKDTFPSADSYENCVIFDVGHNKWRVVAKVEYELKAVYVRAVMDHKEYDKKTWKMRCGCRKKDEQKRIQAQKRLQKKRARAK